MIPLATNSAQPTETISTLISERRQYEEWLTALEARHDSVPPAVYVRVQTDYEARLAGVMERIGNRSTELRETVETLSRTVATLQAEEDAKREQRAEAELRAAVGEYSESQWEELRSGTDAELGRIEEKRADVANELGRVQELLAAATAPPRTPTPPVSRDGAPQAAQPQQPAPEPRAAAAQPSQPVQLPQPQAVAPAPVRAPAPNAAATVAPSGPPPVHATMLDALGGAPAPTPAPQRRPPPGTPGSNKTASSPGGVPVFLRDAKSGQEKTLRCAECGTMNYPTEWYCERCGGELAAM